ncbi:metalloregulator ArsR/SmtB family transcription factor [Litoribrevibacter euphylliae]|uniref:Metalloregulator ArsR/SmtB family transcription factor n=1 Tax=Litoribrevibacter euphylliae TaxID=1834034 RepID=A0ABV7H9U4_9GAMM
MTDPVNFYKCLADDTRLRCLLLITKEQELCVCELTTAINESQPKISRHLAQLKKCGLLTDRRQGQWIYYRLNPELTDWARDVISSTLDSNTSFIATNLKNLNAMGDRPQRVETCCG